MYVYELFFSCLLFSEIIACSFRALNDRLYQSCSIIPHHKRTLAFVFTKFCCCKVLAFWIIITYLSFWNPRVSFYWNYSSSAKKKDIVWINYW